MVLLSNLVIFSAHLSVMPRKPKQSWNMAKAWATMDEILAARTRLQHTIANFMKVDLETALTFCQIARESQDPNKRARNRHHARRGYDTVLSLIRKVNLTEQESQELAANLEKLRSELESLGEIL